MTADNVMPTAPAGGSSTTDLVLGIHGLSLALAYVMPAGPDDLGAEHLECLQGLSAALRVNALLLRDRLPS
jgi:hypothetical protein